MMSLADTLRPHGRLLTGYRVSSSRRMIDAVLLMRNAVLVFGTDPAQTERAAIDLADFHAGSRSVPILPVTMVEKRRVILQRPFPFAGAAPAMQCTRLLLPHLLEQVAAFPEAASFDPDTWESADYRPVPALLEAASHLYADHDVASLLVVNSGRGDLARTRDTVLGLLARARDARHKCIIFVTGAPGAGKTLCGLDIAFNPSLSATFLTGNPALIHVLRAALVHDAASRGMQAKAAAQRIDAVLRPLHHFRDHHLSTSTPPAERILVIDEAQRAWSTAYAVRKTRSRPIPLTASEPAVLLDIMDRHKGFAAIVCLLGGGQEIHAGEAGLAGWSAAIAPRPGWHPAAPPAALTAPDRRQQLDPPATIQLHSTLHLGEPVRAWRAPRLVAWVDAVLGNDPAAARALVKQGLPLRTTRSLDDMRSALRRTRHLRPSLRTGLVASAGARRLRAEGLGGLLWHQDQDAVAAWFLRSWPDIRSSDALEVAATEFGVQGLELDEVGLCWDADLVRTPDGGAWQARAFRATAWTLPKDPETLSNRLNAYRVLLTRARRQTLVWIPKGDPRDPTRDPARYDAIALFLESCGARPLDPTGPIDEDVSMSQRPFL